MADEQKIGYVYLNSVYEKGYEMLNSLDQSTARYKITDPDNMIIYIKECTTIETDIKNCKKFLTVYGFNSDEISPFKFNEMTNSINRST